MAGEDPLLMGDEIQVEMEHVTVGIEYLRQSVPRLSMLQVVADDVVQGHGC